MRIIEVDTQHTYRNICFCCFSVLRAFSLNFVFPLFVEDFIRHIYEEEDELFQYVTLLQKAEEGKIEMLTDGKEERQFLHAEDCSRCLLTLSEKYDEIDRESNLHITNFGWNTILEVSQVKQFISETITLGNSIIRSALFTPSKLFKNHY